jgi:chromosome segregation protein
MPLRLKSLELHGYKTFASKTNFEFAEGITAIVGPNGSGKSNIADALRWVFGEQSYSLLRAKRTEDMIYAGSEQRPRAGMASAGVIFDNGDGWLPVEFSEVSLSRRSYRDGRNEYLLNSQHVRLKDITELLAQSGLSERTYTILGQGLVDASLALKADERRRLFEEAAGVGLYRARREEALRRLENTKRNLDRVLDIMAELEPRLKSLERQAARARDYAQLQSDLRVLLLEWYGFHWHRTQRELKEALELGRIQESKLEEARKSYLRIRQDFTTFRDRLNGLRGKLNSWHRQSAQLHATRESTSGNLAVLDERQRALLDGRQSALSGQSRLVGELKTAEDRFGETDAEAKRLLTEFDEAQIQAGKARAALDECKSEKFRIEADVQSARLRVEEAARGFAGLEAHLVELASRGENHTGKLATLARTIVLDEKALDEASLEFGREEAVRKQQEKTVKSAETVLEIAQNKQTDLEKKVKEKNSERSTRETERAQVKAQLDVLEQAEQSFSGYAEGTKLLLEASRKADLGGGRGALSSLLDVPVDLEIAVAAALGEYTDAILLESGKDAEHAMVLLASNQSGRASLLPLDWLAPMEPLQVKKSADCLGIASDLVNTSMEYRPVVDLLLGQVIIVRDRAAARFALAGQPKRALAVTLGGEVFYGTGQVSAGSAVKVAALGRPRRRRELNEALKSVQQSLEKLEKELGQLNIQNEIVVTEVAESRQNLARERALLQSMNSTEREVQVRVESLKRQLDWNVHQKADIESEIKQLEKDHAQTVAAMSANEEKKIQAQENLRTISAGLAAITEDEYLMQVKFWETTSAVAARALNDARDLLGERKNMVDGLQNQLVNLAARLQEIERALEELESTRKNLHDQASGINSQLEELRVLIEPAEKELEDSESQEIILQKQETEGQFTQARIERTNNQIQLELGRKQEALANLRQKIEDDFGLVEFEYASDVSGPVPLPFNGMVEQLPAVKELSPDLEESVTRLRAQLRRMGAVNPEAKNEYQSVQERHAFLTAQMDDLHKAETDLRQVISELDEITRRKFLSTFEAVAEQFHTTFHRLFGGGMARLVLTDPENLTETGIDIEARLPGRREQGLSLLSGGERSLTAIALVFSLLKVSPTPVCVLDEVDAMLDEANVNRFRDLLVELSRDTQFIIITHNRNTVQVADVIYGVTMSRDSASQIISLRLDEISEDYLK